MTANGVVITGGNSGIGYECARSLVRAGWRVVIASRDRAASAAAVARLREGVEESAVLERGLDLGSLSSVRTFVGELEDFEPPLAALVCNAGLQVNRLRLSPDGYEQTFAVNHLGHFLLTNLLVERLAASGAARIIVVSSGVHDPARWTGMPWPAISDIEVLARTGALPGATFEGRRAYANSKLCNLWFAYELDRRLQAARLPICVNGFDPGLVPGSGLARDYPGPLRTIWNTALPALAQVATHLIPGINPAPKAGAALARLVMDPKLSGVSGKYFPSHTRWEPAKSSVASYDAGQARALWETSVQLAGLKARAF